MSVPTETLKSVAIHSPGDMGHAIGRELVAQGFDVVACVSERSERTQKLCDVAGIRKVENVAQLLAQSDVVLSVVVPAEAESVARQFAAVMRQQSLVTHYVDCNAVSPNTAKRIGEAIVEAGAIYTDASIIGFPPVANSVSPRATEPAKSSASDRPIPRLYVAGPSAATIGQLGGRAFEVLNIGEKIGRASAMKMCYAALTKGSFALQYALLLAALKLDVFHDLISEFEHSQAAALSHMRKSLPKLPAKAHRWVEEMLQISETLEGAGAPAEFHQAAATMFQLISDSPVGKESPESIDLDRTLEETIALIAGDVDANPVT